jgi:hypothetical protein
MRHCVPSSPSDGQAVTNRPALAMSTLRSAATLCRVSVPRARVPPSHPHALSRPFWQQAAVRSGPCRQPRAGFSPSGFSQPLLPRPRIPPLPASPHHCRAFRHLAQQPNNTPQSTATGQSSPPPSTVTVSNAEQRRRDWAIVRRLAVHMWPKDDWGTRGRVALGVGLLIGGKVRRASA